MTKHRPDTAAAPAIPDDNAPLPPARRPTRWTVRTGRTIAFALVGLALAASLLSVYLTYAAAVRADQTAAAVERRLTVLEEDLAERTRQRDAERDAAAERDAETREQLRQLLCEVLADLPAESPGAAEVRARLGCEQPGVAAPSAADLPPTEEPANAAAEFGPEVATSGPATAAEERPSSPAPTAVPDVAPAPADGGAPQRDDEQPTTPPTPPAPSPQPGQSEPARGPVADLTCSLLPLLC
ncbi:hypothetical protein [Geodermatophilus chilensis]|uniref:hypothetical protein n=1 Tax=Geodermatophilus chilensis TaxID=2035835 RepID=UPI000C258354|nr:hypothetical protein [Geodermatophilus chilensis]